MSLHQHGVRTLRPLAAFVPFLLIGAYYTAGAVRRYLRSLRK